MKTLAVVSLKGGVGKTTLAANLADAFARAGHTPVAVVDLDPQNGLAWHFDSGLASEPGLLEAATADAWIGPGYALENDAIIVFPFGQTTEAMRLELELRLSQAPGWLGDQLHRHFPAPHGIAVLDTPPYHSVHLEQALACADHVLVVLTPDVAAVATVSDIEAMLDRLQERRPEVVTHYLLNRVEPDPALGDALAARLRARFGPRLLELSVRRDEAVAEALAFQQPVSRYAPDADASQDIDALARRLELHLAP